MHDSILKVLKTRFPNAPLKAVNTEYAPVAKNHLDNLTKPVGSLGRLEEIASRLYVIAAGRLPLTVDPSIMLTMAADHGVAAQKVSPFPQEVTRQMVKNFLHNGAAINVLCDTFNMKLKIVDAGCAGDRFDPHPLLIDKRIAQGSRDISKEAAMSEAQCLDALSSGFALGLECAKKYALLATGEMGIANTTSATSLFCRFLNLSPDKVTGPGAGANPEMLAHKKMIISKALALHAQLPNDPLAILAALGGFEIAMMCGFMLSCAASSKPFLVDGFIATAAYLVAVTEFPPLASYAFLAHTSAEPGYALILEKLPDKPKPLLDLSMRLGEGTGCVMALSILRGACAIYNNMATLQAAGVSATEADRLD